MKKLIVCAALSLTGCNWGHWLYNKNLYEDRLAGLSDNDQDGFSPDAGDCDDTDGSINPDADETCSSEDRNCDGDLYLDAIDAQNWYADLDEDGYGSLLDKISACIAPAGFVDNSDDCDDSAPDIWEGAPEIPYDGIDQDCDGTDIDDLDLDGVVSTEAGGTDCNDEDDQIYPDAEESWSNGATDNNCDGKHNLIVDAFSSTISGATAGSLFGASIVPLRDIDGDGSTEFLSSSYFESSVYIVNGVDGDSSSDFPLLFSNKTGLGGFMVGGYDLTSDNINDIMLYDDETIWLISGSEITFDSQKNEY